MYKVILVILSILKHVLVVCRLWYWSMCGCHWNVRHIRENIDFLSSKKILRRGNYYKYVNFFFSVTIIVLPPKPILSLKIPYKNVQFIFFSAYKNYYKSGATYFKNVFIINIFRLFVNKLQNYLGRVWKLI